jgi:hypothetical protein
MQGLDYNTQRERLLLPEYGREIQKMVEHAVSLPLREDRLRCAKTIVKMMAKKMTQMHDNADQQQALWDHLYIISNYQLDVDSPFAPPTIESQRKKPQHIGYQNNDIKYGHYGQYLIKMIEAASQEENDEVREALAYSLASQMKRNYLDWNKSVVNDQVILDDLKNISGGRLVIGEESKLNSTSDILGKVKQKPQQQQQPGKKKKKKVPNLKANMNNPNNPAYKLRMQQMGKV